MFRSLSIIAIVAGISTVISGWEHAQADRHIGNDWIRTVDGWEPSAVLDAQLVPSVPPALHPGLVAGFVLGASLFVLLAFPRQQAAATSGTPAPAGRPHFPRGATPASRTPNLSHAARR